MLTIIFAGAAAVCGVGWLRDRIGLLAVCKYLADHDTVPPDEELRSACRFVMRRMLKLPA